jgi:uncharacterized protein
VYLSGGIVDLERLALSSGQARSLDLEVGLEPIVLAGQSYAPTGGRVDATVDVSKTSTGYALRLRFNTELTGPCVRCLEPAATKLEIDSREVDQPAANDDELRSPYVTDGNLDVGRWANDALVLGFPAQPLCREDCAGLCAVCGANLNLEPGHAHEPDPDPRWAKLKELRFE